MRTRAWSIAALLFGSGFCALVYQIGWLREFRLIFGASTAASAAVLAIFIGGLGIGGRVLGPRADDHPRPLLWYALLEAAVALSAALSPIFLALVRLVYFGAGGNRNARHVRWDALAARAERAGPRGADDRDGRHAAGRRARARATTAAELSRRGDFGKTCREPVGQLEPFVPWSEYFLRLRRDCYRAAGDARLALAERELADFYAHEPAPLAR